MPTLSAIKGYFMGCYSGMISSLIPVNLPYDSIVQIFNKKEVGEVMGIDKKDLVTFIERRIL